MRGHSLSSQYICIDNASSTALVSAPSFSFLPYIGIRGGQSLWIQTPRGARRLESGGDPASKAIYQEGKNTPRGKGMGSPYQTRIRPPHPQRVERIKLGKNLPWLPHALSKRRRGSGRRQRHARARHDAVPPELRVPRSGGKEHASSGCNFSSSLLYQP